MEYFNYLSYTLSIILIIFLTRATIKVIRRNMRLTKAKKQHKAYEKKAKELKKAGYKPFAYNQGKTTVWAKSYKEANAQYQTNRNGMFN